MSDAISMKALSLTQPWADVIVEEDKRLENRVDRGPWRAGCSYRGPVLLHAAIGLGTRRALAETIQLVRSAGVPQSFIDERFERVIGPSTGLGYWRPRPKLRLGGFVGLAKIVDALDDRPTIYGGFSKHIDFLERTRPDFKNQRRFWFGGFALVLADVEPLPFVPWSGALGLFNVDLRKLVELARMRTDAPEIGSAYSTLGAE